MTPVRMREEIFDLADPEQAALPAPAGQVPLPELQQADGALAGIETQTGTDGVQP